MNTKFQRSASCSQVGSQRVLGDAAMAYSKDISSPSLQFDDRLGNRSFRPNMSAPFPRNSSEHSSRLMAFGYNLTSSLTDAIIVYPCLVLRRKCQVSHLGRRYHLTPFSLINVVVSLQQSQGITCMWKGVGSHLMINAITFGVESSMSELNENLELDVNRHSKVKKLLGHVLLKALSAATVMPFFSSQLVESVESEAASETRGIFGFIFEGLYRLAGYAGIQSHRLLPLRRLLIPTVFYFVTRYLLSNFLEFMILRILKYTEKRRHESLLNSAHPFSPVEKEFAGLPEPIASSEIRKPVNSLYTARTASLESQYHEFLSNFFGNLITDVLLYPFETVLFRLHVQGTRTIIDDMDKGRGFLPVSSHHEGFFDCYRTCMINEGKLGLFRGFGSLVLQYVMRFSVFEMVHRISRLYY